MSYFIITTDPRRAATWERIFGTHQLPVMTNRARWQTGSDGHLIYAYDLALTRLSIWQCERLASYAARRWGRPYNQVKQEIGSSFSWPILARDCRVVVEDVEATETRPSPFLFPVGRYNGLALVG